jgi:hypothetical protein
MSLLMMFFSMVPLSSPERMWSFFLDSLTFRMNLNAPTVVFPAAVVKCPREIPPGPYTSKKL